MPHISPEHAHQTNLVVRRFALMVIAATGFGLMVIGLRYLLADEFMPYHAHVAQAEWSDLTHGLQAIIRGMLAIVGAGFFACGVALLWLLLPMQRGASWSHWAVLSIGLLIGIPTLYVTITLRVIAPGAPTPVALTAILLSAVVVGSFAQWKSLRRRNSISQS